jgi:hypothetical protein
MVTLGAVLTPAIQKRLPASDFSVLKNKVKLKWVELAERLQGNKFW